MFETFETTNQILYKGNMTQISKSTMWDFFRSYSIHQHAGSKRNIDQPWRMDTMWRWIKKLVTSPGDTYQMTRIWQFPFLDFT
jgi:hypothetical protein